MRIIGWLSFLLFCPLLLANDKQNAPYVVVLGIAQDAGYPQAGCYKTCCVRAWKNPENKRFVSSLALVIPKSNEVWLFDATPDFTEQIHLLKNMAGKEKKLKGIFLTHGHMGHYTGLMYLGREVMGKKNVIVYAMPRMEGFLKKNGPWSQLVALKNIKIIPLQNNTSVSLNSGIVVTPFLVPHRDEYTETVGYKIASSHKSLVFIPDIDKWAKWQQDITKVIKEVDIAFIDGTFYKNGEIPGRDMSKIPHPFIVESMELFKDLSREQKSKIHFIHLNHTNPALRQGKQRDHILRAGYKVARQKQVIKLGP